MQSMDQFKRGISFSIGDNMYSVSSGWGVCVTILCALMCFLYIIEKLFVQDNLTFFTETTVFDTSDEFSREDGFNFAFAYSPYEGPLNKRFEHPSNFTLEASLYSWMTPANSLTTLYQELPLRTHVCTEEELGLVNNRGEEALFYPINEVFEKDARRMVGNWQCFDKNQPLDLQGFYSSARAT